MPVKPLYNEKVLLQEISSGNETAFAQLFDHYRPNIYTTVLRMTGSAQEAEEVLQDTFLKVWLKRASLPDLANFGGWVYTIAENLTYNTLKSKQRNRSRTFQVDPDLGPWTFSSVTAEDHLLDKEYAVLLSKAIKQLPDKQRQTYILIKQEGMKREEAARVLHISPETVKWNLDQAMRSIRAFCLAHLEILPLFLLLFPRE